ncbi:L,D-transpeptidase family protein [Roseovarius sp. SCSIO 43702]|uniref:L,D-transpeptidase family protein n=1 Tax=Roseovarius sp. SCSIO 43702 TaxID=2823043 RepID=UPI001C73A848|nr:L,D-transpeptidase family protein [Roseovarius sp. SCSIO 43702]QYX57017.1 L,D-transpeptidase family protein [Roseovarius sp. SCSIO 43702]
MRILRIVAVLLAALTVSACGSKFKTYNGPEVTHVVINKGDRRMYLLHHEQVLKQYKIDLGFAPSGHKRFRGDGRTPEGLYKIDRRNPDSAFHLSIGIDYPNERDLAFARMQGKSPGGDIFIHGRPNKKKRGLGRDWTAGCISVKDRHIEDIYAMVRNGTPVTINP